MSKKYRIKTEKEFEKEFGNQWRNIIECSWLSPDMDFLFNMNINDIDFLFDMDIIDANYSIRRFLHTKGWNISYDILIINIPSYKPKRFIKEI
jgi:hypothetical protein